MKKLKILPYDHSLSEYQKGKLPPSLHNHFTNVKKTHCEKKGNLFKTNRIISEKYLNLNENLSFLSNTVIVSLRNSITLFVIQLQISKAKCWIQREGNYVVKSNLNFFNTVEKWSCLVFGFQHAPLRVVIASNSTQNLMRIKRR